MTGRAYFNEVFLTDARVPDQDLIGGEGNGWAVANTTLAFERALSGGGEVGATADPGEIAGNLDLPAGSFAKGSSEGTDHEGGQGQFATLAELAVRTGRARDPFVRDSLVRLYTMERLNTLNTLRSRALELSGSELAGLPNLAKMSLSHQYRLGRELTFSLLQAAGTLHTYDPEDRAALDAQAGISGLGALVDAALFAQAPPIYGGSDQIQRNIVGERVLGLPARAERRQRSAVQGSPEKLTPSPRWIIRGTRTTICCKCRSHSAAREIRVHTGVQPWPARQSPEQLSTTSTSSIPTHTSWSRRICGRRGCRRRSGATTSPTSCSTRSCSGTGG